MLGQLTQEQRKKYKDYEAYRLTIMNGTTIDEELTKRENINRRTDHLQKENVIKLK